MGFKFAIDRGGTFTDVYVEYPDKSQFVYKLLSEDYHYQDAPSEAIRRLISKVYNLVVWLMQIEDSWVNYLK